RGGGFRQGLLGIFYAPITKKRTGEQGGVRGGGTLKRPTWAVAGPALMPTTAAVALPARERARQLATAPLPCDLARKLPTPRLSAQNAPEREFRTAKICAHFPRGSRP